jgi:crotonobetainyl-CoA:carnitine CoA-transferase CaiB-like acyl-CoA transferase
VPSFDEILADEALHRGMISVSEHPVIGNYRVLGPGMIFDETPITVRRLAPRLSEHTAEVLAEVSYTAEGISTLMTDGVAGAPND